jgi:GAF domain-containing protein
MKAATPVNEAARLRALREYQILDTANELDFDEIVRLAATACQTPTAMITLVDESRQWFKSAYGLPFSETHRDLSFCAHAILAPGILVIPDATQDARFADNPLVTAPPISGSMPGRRFCHRRASP